MNNGSSGSICMWGVINGHGGLGIKMKGVENINNYQLYTIIRGNGWIKINKLKCNIK